MDGTDGGKERKDGDNKRMVTRSGLMNIFIWFHGRSGANSRRKGSIGRGLRRGRRRNEEIFQPTSDDD